MRLLLFLLGAPVLDDYLRAAKKLRCKKALDPGGRSAELLDLFFRESPDPSALTSWLNPANGAISGNQLVSVVDLARLVMLSKPGGGTICHKNITQLIRKKKSNRVTVIKNNSTRTGVPTG